MRIFVDAQGLDAMIMRLSAASAAVPGLMQQAVRDAGQMVVDDLSAAAPVGASEGMPPPGDGPGHLNESFYAQDEGETTVSVRTRQPLKLQYVTQGTGIYAGKGRIRPRTAKALMWPGAAHPYRSVAGEPPNDFVSPVIDGFDGQEALLPIVDELIAIIEG